MAIVSNPSESLLQGLSSFWTRLFADQKLLKSIYQGTNSLLAQVYLDLIETVLNGALNNTPVFHRELWKPMFIRQDQIIYTAGITPDGDRYQVLLEDGVTNFTYLYNQIFGPSRILEEGLDFDFQIVPSADQTTQQVYLGFYDDPFTSNNGGVINGVPVNAVPIVPTVYQSGGDGIVAVNGGSGPLPTNAFHSNSVTFTPYDTTHQLNLTGLGRASGLYNIVAVLSTQDVLLEPAVGGSITFTKTVGVQWSLQSTPVVEQISMWAPDCLIDKLFLAQNYGQLVNVIRPSSANYKSLLQGIFQYFMLGPALNRLEAALNVINGFPVASSDSEIALSYSGGLLTTNLNVYGPFNSGMPLRSDIEASLTASPPASFPLRAFEALSGAFIVNDVYNNPTWWWNITIPQELLPDDNLGRLQVTPNLYEAVYGMPSGNIPKYGDPNFLFGTDDGGLPQPRIRYPLRHNYAYTVMDRYLQWNMFQVSIAAGVTLNFTADEFKSVILAGKPSYTYLLMEIFPTLTDTLSVTDSVTVIVT